MKFFALILFLAAAQIGVAEEDRRAEAEKGDMRYVVKIIAKMNRGEPVSELDKMLGAWGMGYLQGFKDNTMNAILLGAKLPYWIPNEVTTGQLAAILDGAYEKEPEKAVKDGKFVLIIALMGKYPNPEWKK